MNPRPIEFRAWNEDMGRMFSAEELGEDEITINPDGRGFVNVSGVSTKLSQYYPHMIPMQYIGYRDVNVTKIYEMDVLKDDVGRILLVEWWEAGFTFKAITKTNFMRARRVAEWFEDDVTERPKIIGNVFENPELLGGDA